MWDIVWYLYSYDKGETLFEFFWTIVIGVSAYSTVYILISSKPDLNQKELPKKRSGDRILTFCSFVTIDYLVCGLIADRHNFHNLVYLILFDFK